MSSEKVKIDKISTSKKDIHTPVLLNFQNGYLNKDIKDSVYYFEAFNENKKDRTAVLATRNGNLYNGKIEDSSNNNNLVNTFVAIRNKKTNKVQLIQIEEASMINEIYNTKDITSTSENTETDNPALIKTTLIKNFGGRKAIVNYERTERMKVNVDIVKQQLDKTIESTEINNDDSIDDIKNIEENLQLIRPQINENAKNIKDVYLVNDIIPKDLLDRLNEECYVILSEDIASIPISSEFILNKIKSIRNSENPTSPDNLTQIKICLYLDGLINLIKTRQRIMTKIELSKITEKIENHLRVNFSDPSLKARTKTKFTTDKALCYFIVLSFLISENYEIDIDILSQELSTPAKKIIKYARLVNSRLKTGTKTLCLQLPGKVKTNLIVKSRRV